MATLAYYVEDLGGLSDVDASDTTVGYVPTRQADGTFAMEAGGAGAATVVPLTTIDPSSGEPALVWDEDDQLVLTELP